MPEEEFGKFVGHYAYEPNLPMDDPNFRARMMRLVTPVSVTSFYFRHPSILAKVLAFDLRQAAANVNLNFEPRYGHLREADVLSGKHPFELTAWSGLRHWLFRISAFHLVYFFALALSWSAFCALNPKLRPRVPVWRLIPFSTGLAVCSFLFASLLDAAETSRHLVFFQAVTDLTIFEFLFSILLLIDDRPGLFKALDTVAESQHVHQLLGRGTRGVSTSAGEP